MEESSASFQIKMLYCARQQAALILICLYAEQSAFIIFTHLKFTQSHSKSVLANVLLKTQHITYHMA